MRRSNSQALAMKQLSLILLVLASPPFLIAQTPLLDQLGITVTGTDRQFACTNKEAGTYYGEVNGHNARGWQCWFINAQKILSDYSLESRRASIDRTTATTMVFPHQLVRTY